ncbi:alpha/beta hydrolase [Nocardia cyriacigeorgica]|uniref:alpha/beta hydrolase n=1 Tax=Nocardia cyriacigeorgica TaxID=135487 RepID=UPI0013D08375|nr:alpha/beta hydrolase family protein [Nocardia cyriacigeorgica]NEW28472.1 esterase family protein [Nocardia cyriacigeorgica]
MRGRYLRQLGLLAAAVTATAILPVSASAEPTESRAASSIVSVSERDARNVTLTVHSAAMDLDIPVEVMKAADTGAPRPVLYLLLGAGGGVDGANWGTKTDVLDFLADKNVHAVSPIGGMFSYYADWRTDDPRLGKQKWKTFLTSELPPLIDEYLGSNGRNGIAGFSMSGTSSLALAATTGDLYDAAAAYSGCAQISDPAGQEFVRLTIEEWGLADKDNMYGPPSDPAWAANDPYVQAEGLRGKALYISSGSGLPGMYDQYGGKYSLEGPWLFANQIVLGGIIEAATNYCSHNMQDRLNDLGIPATYNFRPDGTHSWGYWQDALKDSWPTLAPALGI